MRIYRRWNDEQVAADTVVRGPTKNLTALIKYGERNWYHPAEGGLTFNPEVDITGLPTDWRTLRWYLIEQLPTVWVTNWYVAFNEARTCVYIVAEYQLTTYQLAPFDQLDNETIMRILVQDPEAFEKLFTTQGE